MKIAIIGAGISGLTAAYLLHSDHEIEVFDSNNYVGGHTHTIDIEHENENYSVDTGFIVFNRVTYPNFCRLIDMLGVNSQLTEMTFSVSCERTGLEYSPHSLNDLFVQRRNIFSPEFYRMLYEIFRFRKAMSDIGKLNEETGIGMYLRDNKYSGAFINNFIVPLGSSLWSADPDKFMEFPLRTFVRFFKNHGFLDFRNPFQWQVIRGGSKAYVEKLIEPFIDSIRLESAVQSVTRRDGHIELKVHGTTERFDHVIIAVHSDQALRMLDDPSEDEREVLGAIPYQENLAILHTDTAILPENRKIWSSWNYHIPEESTGCAVLTYDMSILQSINSYDEFCVTLNGPKSISPDKEIGRYIYQHPVFTRDTPAAQKSYLSISGVNRTHYCGAYWGYGFHEDGVNSALAACRYFEKGL